VAEDSKIPPKNSAQWIKNEKIINTNPILRAARDQSEGLGSSGRSTGVNSQAYLDGWDAIFGKKDKKDD
jgi:hypothetical protein